MAFYENGGYTWYNYISKTQHWEGAFSIRCGKQKLQTKQFYNQETQQLTKVWNGKFKESATDKKVYTHLDRSIKRFGYTDHHGGKKDPEDVIHKKSCLHFSKAIGIPHQ